MVDMHVQMVIVQAITYNTRHDFSNLILVYPAIYFFKILKSKYIQGAQTPGPSDSVKPMSIFQLNIMFILD